MDPNSKKVSVILRLFPYLENKEDATKLKIDDDSIHYISIREYAEKISGIIRDNLTKIGIKENDAVITDATAGVGGDTISFAKHFKSVISMEINKDRSEYLQNNIAIYKCDNVTVMNGSCNDLLCTIPEHDVIFIDPPWQPDNTSYKQYDNLRLSIGLEPIEDFCNKLMNPSYMKCVPKLIVFKLPNNYDIAHFYKTVNIKNIYYYPLPKMIILVVLVNLSS
ncbi:RNA cap guanine-N2 methyltransferase [Fadolivirus algeromassiliense]|jgi:tRNA G37 N-methylase Trm5|uniref:RNA cap guanine-N2 methyltransferase n=1 Tax=Fadolivirus FV1/VV64 TaxID=3070911 RepID=A0A7D3QU30_9VIRU|nr:RNA cap guanine-N2 methyltransferase [Fadolivirus algeromassiliense]QKF93825.1 RNA cap guanine-N2 methyltransferase [Fadolivirus FV1/VV64]